LQPWGWCFPLCWSTNPLWCCWVWKDWCLSFQNLKQFHHFLSTVIEIKIVKTLIYSAIIFFCSLFLFFFTFLCQINVNQNKLIEIQWKLLNIIMVNVISCLLWSDSTSPIIVDYYTYTSNWVLLSFG
jgi:hypothetical protein